MWKKNWPSLLALIAIVGLLASTRGGISSLLPFARLLIPIVILWGLFRWGKSRLKKFAAEAIQKQMARQGRHPNAPFGARSRNDGSVVDLCPKCGAQITRNHRC